MDAFNRELNQLLVMAYRKINKLEEGILTSVSGMDLSIGEMHLLEAVGRKRIMACLYMNLHSAWSYPAHGDRCRKQAFEKRICGKEQIRTDKRSVIVKLTRIGKKMDAAHRYFHEQMVRDIDKLLTPEERDGLLRGMKQLNLFFQNALDDLEAKKLKRRAQIQIESV